MTTFLGDVYRLVARGYESTPEQAEALQVIIDKASDTKVAEAAPAVVDMAAAAKRFAVAKGELHAAILAVATEVDEYYEKNQSS